MESNEIRLEEIRELLYEKMREKEGNLQDREIQELSEALDELILDYMDVHCIKESTAVYQYTVLQ